MEKSCDNCRFRINCAANLLSKPSNCQNYNKWSPNTVERCAEELKKHFKEATQ
jgi:hypothetical protein